MTPSQYLESLGACEEAVAWAGQFHTYDHALRACEIPAWYAWIAARLSGRKESKGRSRLKTALSCVASDYAATLCAGSESDTEAASNALVVVSACAAFGTGPYHVLRMLLQLRAHYPDHASITAWETETIEGAAHTPGRRIAAKPITPSCWKCRDDRVHCWVCGERENECLCRNGERNIGDCTECNQRATVTP